MSPSIQCDRDSGRAEAAPPRSVKPALHNFLAPVPIIGDTPLKELTEQLDRVIPVFV